MKICPYCRAKVSDESGKCPRCFAALEIEKNKSKTKKKSEIKNSLANKEE